MGLQRHLKVLGIFCRLKHRDGKPAYSADLPRFFGYAHKVSARYNALRPLSRLLEPLMGTEPHRSVLLGRADVRAPAWVRRARVPAPSRTRPPRPAPPMLRITDLRLPLEHPPEDLRRAVVARLGIDDGRLLGVTVHKRSYDARKKSAIVLTYTVDCEIAGDEAAVLAAPCAAIRTCARRRT